MSESERMAELAHIEVGAGREQYQVIAGAAVGRDGCERVGMHSTLEQKRNELVCPPIDLATCAASHRGADGR
jgi:hypothetical protein